MNILVYGAGTIGLTYAWLLSNQHQVTVLVREDKLSTLEQGFTLSIKDLRKDEQAYKEHHFQPPLVTSIDQDYDLILLTVNSLQLEQALDHLAAILEYQLQDSFLFGQKAGVVSFSFFCWRRAKE